MVGSAVLPARESLATGHPIAGFFASVEQPLHQYRALRRMHTTSETGKYEAWLDVWTELKDGHFNYQIVSEKGSETVRGKVLRPLLAHEQEVVNNGEDNKSDYSAANYEFREAGRNRDGARVVQITPRRQEVMLVEGHAVLDEVAHRRA